MSYFPDISDRAKENEFIDTYFDARSTTDPFSFSPPPEDIQNQKIFHKESKQSEHNFSFQSPFPSKEEEDWIPWVRPFETYFSDENEHIKVKRTLRMKIRKIEKRRRKAQTTEKKANERRKPQNSHRNVMSVLFKFFLKKMMQGELDFPFEELMLAEEDLYYPPQFYLEADKWSWKEFIEDLWKKEYFNIGFFRQWWILPGIDEKAVESVLKGKMEEWKEVHFFVCLKRYFRIFLEEHAFYALFMDYRVKDRFINLEDYFTYIPCILNAMNEPKTFYSLKIN